MEIFMLISYNKAIRIIKNGILPYMKEEGFYYLEEEEKSKMTNQYFELVLITFSLIEIVLNEKGLKNVYNESRSKLFDNILNALSCNEYLKNSIDVESEAFYYCFRDRIGLYKIELERSLRKKYDDWPFAVFYYFLFDPGNVWTTSEYTECEMLNTKDFIENGNDSLSFDEFFFMGIIREVYSLLTKEIA